MCLNSRYQFLASACLASCESGQCGLGLVGKMGRGGFASLPSGSGMQHALGHREGNGRRRRSFYRGLLGLASRI